MMILDCGNEVYDNAIEMYFHEYFENRGIDISGDGYKRVETNLFNGAFRYVYRKLFKPSRGEKYKYGKSSRIDYDDVFLLDEIVEKFNDICTDYNVTGKQDMFCDMTGIHRSTLHRWKKGETRGSIYYDLEGNLIKDIQAWKLNGRGDYVKAPSTAHCDIAEKVASVHNKTANNKLNDFPIGQVTIANNDKDAGMEYNDKTQKEYVEARRTMKMDELPVLGDKSPDNGGDLGLIEEKE